MQQQPELETRTYTQQEIDAQRITCPVCHAPVGQPCVEVKWHPTDGIFGAQIKQRDFHPKRLKRSDTYRSKHVHTG